MGRAKEERGNPQARGVIIEELRSRWLSLLLVGVTMLTGTAVSLLQPFFYKSLFDEAIPSADTPMILWLLLAMVITPIAAIGLAYAQDYLRVRIGEYVSQALRERLFDHLVRLRIPEMDKLTPAEVSQRITASVGRIGELYIEQELLPSISHTIVLIGTLGAMLALNLELAAISCVAIPITWVVTSRLSRNSKERDRAMQRHRESRAAHIVDVSGRTPNGQGVSGRRTGKVARRRHRAQTTGDFTTSYACDVPQ